MHVFVLYKDTYIYMRMKTCPSVWGHGLCGYRGHEKTFAFTHVHLSTYAYTPYMNTPAAE